MDTSQKPYHYEILTAVFYALLLSLAPVQIQVDLVNFSISWSHALAEETHSDGHSGGHSGGYRGGNKDHGHEETDSSHNGKKGHVSNRSPAQAVETDVLRGHGRDSRPVWAGGGIPEIELGRLNVSRAPSFVLDRALAEAQGELANDPTASVHSPLANLAMYRETLKTSALNEEQIEAAARYLGAAADKNIVISDETIEAVNLILGTGLNLSNDQVNSIAMKADAVRAEILAAHDTNEEEHTSAGHSH